jgi:hypothetical protein
MDLNSFRLSAACVVLAFAIGACGDGATEPVSVTGSYTATTFVVAPSGQPAMDVIAKGGSLSIVIASDNTVTGNLLLPASVTGGAVFTASMAGTVTRNGASVQFQQSADTFVRNLSWTPNGNTLQVTNQVVAATTYTITLTR